MDGSNPPPSPPKRSRWVLYSTPDSIAAGQISLFALVEIPIATIVFGWLALHNPWPWTSLLGLLAAPILLLRSDPAVEMGVRMLREWTGRWESADTHWYSEFVGGVVVWLMGFGLTVSACGYLPTTPTFWQQVSSGVLLAWGLQMLGVSFGFALTGRIVRSFAAHFIAIIGGSCALLQVDSSLSPWFLWLYNFIVVYFYLYGHGKFSFYVAGDGVMLGFVWRSLFISMKSVSLNVGHGFRAISANWSQVVLSIDPLHLPELLPRAGEVQYYFSLGRLAAEPGCRHLISIFAPILYIPALLYRWNIKASWWLWGPVALMLRPARWGNDEDMRVEMARWAVLPTWSGLAWFALIVLGAMGILNLPSELFGPYKGLVGTLKGLAPPLLSLRTALVCLFLVSLAVFYGAAHCLREPYKKAFESPDEFRKMLPEEKARFAKLARIVRIGRQVVTALFIFGIWSFALEFALETWPDQMADGVWPWLQPWL